ncbi:hypothetical protein, partial [Nonomuraea longicatena]|uniref:hypothetical protein n=1 Tax=Nonomuraea longicatena TaxID=83682 RepID=UPI0031D7BA1C
PTSSGQRASINRERNGLAPLDDLIDEFAQLWQAAKQEEENNGSALVPEGRPETVGDILAPEEPPPYDPPTPDAWGEAGKECMWAAENGNPRAAYEVAVLLACEAAGTPDDDPDSERLRLQAAVWRGRAIGKVPEAAILPLNGQRLVAAARALADSYADDSDTMRLFSRAAVLAGASLPDVRPFGARRRARALLRRGEAD